MRCNMSELDNIIVLNDEDGNEIELNTGKTYVTLIPSDSWDDLVIK